MRAKKLLCGKNALQGAVRTGEGSVGRALLLHCGCLQTFEVTRALAAHLGKTTCVSADRAGFIVNRVSALGAMSSAALREGGGRGSRLGLNFSVL